MPGFGSVLPGPKTRKPPGFRQKKPPLAGVFLGQIFFRQIFRPTNKCPFLILFVPDLCYFMTSNVWYNDHLSISLQKLDKKLKHRFSKRNLLKSKKQLLKELRPIKKNIFCVSFTFKANLGKKWGKKLKKIFVRRFFFSKSSIFRDFTTKNQKIPK